MLLGFFLVGYCRYQGWSEMDKVKANIAEEVGDGKIDTFVGLHQVARLQCAPIRSNLRTEGHVIITLTISKLTLPFHT